MGQEDRAQKRLLWSARQDSQWHAAATALTNSGDTTLKLWGTADPEKEEGHTV